MPAQRAVSIVLWASALFGFWLALVGTIEPVELIAGAVAATIGAIAAEAVVTRTQLRIRLERKWLLACRSPVARILPDFAVLAWLLFRSLVLRKPPTGGYRAVPFPAGRIDPSGRGRRALAAWAGSLAPNTVVVDVDEDRKLMLLHELSPRRGTGGPL